MHSGLSNFLTMLLTSGEQPRFEQPMLHPSSAPFSIIRSSQFAKLRYETVTDLYLIVYGNFSWGTPSNLCIRHGGLPNRETGDRLPTHPDCCYVVDIYSQIANNLGIRRRSATHPSRVEFPREGARNRGVRQSEQSASRFEEPNRNLDYDREGGKVEEPKRSSADVA